MNIQCEGLISISDVTQRTKFRLVSLKNEDVSIGVALRGKLEKGAGFASCLRR